VLHQEVLARARERSDAVALVDASTGRTLPYGELAQAVRSFAGGLRERGARAGDVLGLVAVNAPSFAVAMHGALAAGLTVAPASPLLTSRELSAFMDQAGARVAVADLGSRPKLLEAGIEDVLALEDLPAGDPIEVASGSPDAIALVLGTSGTIGLPKCAAHTHAGAVATLRQYAAGELRRFRGDDVVSGIVPFPHMFGSVMLSSALRAGARMVTLPRFEPEAFLRMVQEHRVTVAVVVPPIARFLAQHPLVDRYDLSSLRFVLIGAAPCPAELEEACSRRLGCAVGQGLGMTEAAPIALPEEPVVHGSVGRLVPDTEAMVVDPDSGARLDPGRTGELWLRGPQVMRGYRGDAEATAATIDRDGWLHSGDLGHFDAKGNLFLVDRLKELIKSRGYQVAPAQLEAELAAHPAVADAAVVGRPDEEAGEVPVAYVVLRTCVAPGELAAWVAERVAPYKRLADVIVVDEIPRAPTGKLLRRVLVERERGMVGARRG
jgi:acyl-CoA synthetase (AMP-forming)/AMP-acid ligase II